MKKNIIIYLCFLFLLLLIALTSQVELDGIWGYGFSYNIATGLLPYKDFNMVIGPLYPILFSPFMYLFGNYFYLFEIEHCLLYALVFTFLYNKIGKNSLFILLLYGACLTIFGYNLFCVMLMISILLLIDSSFRHREVFIGIIIGIILMTKQNIGLFLSLAFLFSSKNKTKSFFSLLIPIVPTITYLLINNIFFNYIDFCYFGMGNFLSNISTDFVSIFPYIIFIIPLVKDYIKKRNTKALYVIAFQIIVFPIFDQGHIIPALIPVTYYYLTENTLSKKYSFYFKYFIIIGFIITVIVKTIVECEFVTDNSFLKYQVIKKEISTYIESYSDYIDFLDGDKVYLLIDNAYILRLYRNENPGFYDLINKGNFGSNDNKYIDMIKDDCKDKKCYFILDYYYFNPRLFDQRNLIFKDYVLKNTNYIETLPSRDRLYVSN